MGDGVRHRRFGEGPGGESVGLVTLGRDGTRATIMTWGASLTEFRLHEAGPSVVLGSPDFLPYLTVMRWFGAIVGRVANRIAGGRAAIAGCIHELERNENDRTTLHGGSAGSGSVNWRLEGSTAEACRLAVRLPDGQGGFPGNLDLAATYRIERAGCLVLEIEARTDAPTLCAPAHHAYWRLDPAGTLGDHLLTIDAERYLPVDAAQIPTGAPAAVAGTRFDFRRPRPIRAGDGPLDHNFCLSDRPRALCPVARLEGGGLALAVASTEPGLQVYDGAHIDTAPFAGHGGEPYAARGGLALEPQHWPDAPNQRGYPPVELRPGVRYRQVTQFEVRDAAGRDAQ